MNPNLALANVAAELFVAERDCRNARLECQELVHRLHDNTPELIDARERLKAANWNAAQIRAKRDEMISAMR